VGQAIRADQVLDASEVIVKDEEFRKLAESPQNGHLFIDHLRLMEAETDRKNHVGICW